MNEVYVYNTLTSLQRGPRTITTLREGRNEWVCFPGNQNEVGIVPMASDAQGFLWIKDALSHSTRFYLYASRGSAAQLHRCLRSDESVIPIRPHYMIMWPFDAKHLGFPTKIRDGHGANVMFDGTPYAHLHINGNPWDGTEWEPEKGTRPSWTLQYIKPEAGSGR